jgi:3'(2'), 5'-bisphosphate nucleotidase
MFDLLTPELIKLTTEAGKAIMNLYQDNSSIKIKNNNTPLTIADQKSNKLIITGLNKINNNIPIISEESDCISFKERLKWKKYWLIDPLDGTKDFINKTGEFCVCIAYIENHKPTFGMIYSPITKTHYYAINKKSFKMENNIIKEIKTNPNPSNIRVIIGNYSTNDKKIEDHLQGKKYTLTRMGSALKFCKIAEGDYDYYPRFGTCYEWDTAAGVCILQGAGGSVIDKFGNPLKYNTKDDLISSAFFASSKSY